jgi:pyruvate dehydrogenase E1 component
MTNLAGHGLEAVLEAFDKAADERPTCFIAYTIKGYGLPFAAHKDNHAGLMSPEQIATLRRQMNIKEGQEWEPFAGLDIPADELSAMIEPVPFAQPRERRHRVARIEVPQRFEAPPASGPRLRRVSGGCCRMSRGNILTSPIGS